MATAYAFFGDVLANKLVATGETTLGEATIANATITNATIVNNPSSATSVVNKQYVDSLALGRDTKDSVIAASTSNWAGSYDNVAKTLTGAAEVLQIDGVTLVENDRVLLKNQTDSTENGIYYLSTVGDEETSWVLTRAQDFDMTEKITGGVFVFVYGGNVNKNAGYIISSLHASFALDANTPEGDLVFVQFTGVSAVSAGLGMIANNGSYDIVSADGNIIVGADDIQFNPEYPGNTFLDTVGALDVGSISGAPTSAFTLNSLKLGADTVGATADLTKALHQRASGASGDTVIQIPVAVSADEGRVHIFSNSAFSGTGTITYDFNTTAGAKIQGANNVTADLLTLVAGQNMTLFYAGVVNSVPTWQFTNTGCTLSSL